MPLQGWSSYLDIYHTSYMWFSAIPCLMCIGVGILVTALTHVTKVQSYQDPKKLNPDLISPALPKLFAFWPKFIRKYTMCKIPNFARKMGGCKFDQVNVFLASRD